MPRGADPRLGSGGKGKGKHGAGLPAPFLFLSREAVFTGWTRLDFLGYDTTAETFFAGKQIRAFGGLVQPAGGCEPEQRGWINMSNGTFSRRDFMKVTGAGTAGLVLGGTAKEAAASESGESGIRMRG